MIRQCHTQPGVCAELCTFPPARIPASPKTMSVLQPLYSLLSQQLSHSPDQQILLLLNMKTFTVFSPLIQQGQSTIMNFNFIVPSIFSSSKWSFSSQSFVYFLLHSCVPNICFKTTNLYI